MLENARPPCSPLINFTNPPKKIAHTISATAGVLKIGILTGFFAKISFKGGKDFGPPQLSGSYEQFFFWGYVV